MQKSNFNILVEKLMKKKWKLLSLSDIESMMSHSNAQSITRAQIYKLVHAAKNKWALVWLKKDVYIAADEHTDIDATVQSFYWKMLYDHIKTYLGGHGLITWVNALNLMMQNYGIPDAVSIISRDKQCTETIVRDKKALIKKMSSWTAPLYSLLRKTAQKITVQNTQFYCTSLTVSLLEALYGTSSHDLLTVELCKKVLKKHWKNIDRQEITMLLVKGKYHTSINEMYYIARGIDDAYAQHILAIIKKHSYRLTKK